MHICTGYFVDAWKATTGTRMMIGETEINKWLTLQRNLESTMLYCEVLLSCRLQQQRCSMRNEWTNIIITLPGGMLLSHHWQINLKYTLTETRIYWRTWTPKEWWARVSQLWDPKGWLHAGKPTMEKGRGSSVVVSNTEEITFYELPIWLRSKSYIS